MGRLEASFGCLGDSMQSLHRVEKSPAPMTPVPPQGLHVSISPFLDFFHDVPDSFLIIPISGGPVQRQAHRKIGQDIVLFRHKGAKPFFIHDFRMADGGTAVIDTAFSVFPVIKGALSFFIKKGPQFFHVPGLFAAEATGQAGEIHYPSTFGKKASTFL